MQWNNKVVDPFCRMEVDMKTAIQLEVRGKTFYFCSEECANSFRSYLQNIHQGLKSRSSKVDASEDCDS
ncbi:MAG: YHS domain-containing protein [Nitrososphaerales archaeon]